MRPHVMIVDDALDQLQLMKSVIKMVDSGLRVTTAKSGDEALKLLRSSPEAKPQVILLDVRMPGKSGQEVLRELKADPAFKRIPVCAFSSGELEKDVCEFYANGASFYFKKPDGIDNLKKFIEQFKGLWFDFASHCPL